MRFEPDRVDHRVGAAAGRQVAKMRDGVVVEVEHLDVVPGGHGAALGNRVDGQHAVPTGAGDTGGELADRAEPEHDDGAVGGDVGVLDPLPCRGQDVAEEQVAIVGQGAADLHVVVVRQRHAQILGLPTWHLPVQLRIPEQGGAAAVLAHLRRLALRLQTPPAEPAGAARDVERDDDAVAGGQVLDRGADLDDLAHRLVTEDVASVDERAEQLVEMQIGSADRRGGDADDRVGRFEDARVGNLLDADIALAVPGQCLHELLLCSSFSC